MNDPQAASDPEKPGDFLENPEPAFEPPQELSRLVTALKTLRAVEVVTGSYEDPPGSGWDVMIAVSQDRFGWRALELLAWTLGEIEPEVLFTVFSPDPYQFGEGCLTFLIEGSDRISPDLVAFQVEGISPAFREWIVSILAE